MIGEAMIRRGFVNCKTGQVHYRYAGNGPSLLLCHASPGSAKQLESLIVELAPRFSVFAPDTPGNGDSDPLANETPAIADLAGVLLDFADALGLSRFDVYGSHTGAAIAAEIAIEAPARVGAVILDGLPNFDEATIAEYLDVYAHPFLPDLDGAYLVRAFMFCRDQHLFFPWYARDAAHRRDGGLPSAAELHDWVLEVLKAHATYHRGYRAAFAYPGRRRAQLIRQPTRLLAAIDDPLRAETAAIAADMPDARFVALPRLDDSRLIETIVAAILDVAALTQ